MKKYALAILSILLFSNPCKAQETDTTAVFKTLFKCWHAISHEYSPIYGLEEDEIKAYSKQKVCFSRDSISMYYGTQYTPRYTVKKVNADNYAKTNFDCEKIKLGILADSVYEINISSMSRSAKNGVLHKMTDIIAMERDFIYIVKDGVIFKLYDHNAYTGPRSSN